MNELACHTACTRSADDVKAGRRYRLPVLLPYPFAGPFDYLVPDGLELAPGDVVMVPLNRREEVGVVWDGEPDASLGDNRLRPISARLETPPMAAPLRRLIDWIAAYTLAPRGQVMAMALRVMRWMLGA